MIQTIRKKLHFNRDNETGSDIVTTIFLLPFFVALLFSIIDVSTYFQTRTQVQNVTRDGARLTALMGGTSSSIPLNQDKFGSGGQNVTNYVYSRLVNAGGYCVFSGCTTPPIVNCGPNVATNLTQDAYCDVTYHYSGVGGSIVTWLGFDQITGITIHSRETFKVETAW